jgi:hypothetical protein
VVIPPGTSEFEVPLANAGVHPGASGKARFRQRDDRTEFKVEIEDLPIDTYRIRVGGVDRGPIQVASVVGGTQGEVEYRDPVEPGKVLLDFDPRGQEVAVTDGGGTLLLGIQFP